MSGNKEPRNLTLYALLGFLAVLVITGIAAFGIPYCIGKPLEGPGEFGDMFGGVNAVFSGFAFIGVIWAILLQKEELGLQRQELKDTRQELAGQREQLELQNSTFKQQAFDSILFQMLAIHNQILSDLELHLDKSYSGRNCLTLLYIGHSGLKDSLQAYLDVLDIPQLSDTYREFYSTKVNYLDHYFRNLESILNLIDQENYALDKYRYASIIRDLLSSNELALLFYHCLSDYGSEKFKPLVEKYSLLKNLPDSVLVDPSHKEWYEPSAFG